jgi:hypothetical protein
MRGHVLGNATSALRSGNEGTDEQKRGLGRRIHRRSHRIDSTGMETVAERFGSG